jgi:hypothetical protein
MRLVRKCKKAENTNEVMKTELPRLPFLISYTPSARARKKVKMDLVKRRLRGIASSVRLLILTTAGQDAENIIGLLGM